MVNKSATSGTAEEARHARDLVVDEVVPPILTAADQGDTWLSEEPDWAAETGDALVFSLADLVPDEHGEIVLFNDTDAVIQISTDVPIVETGIAETHVTATGIDVTGMMYSVFEGGPTVYHDTQLDLSFA